MSFKAVLNIAGKKYNVLETHYSFTQPITIDGHSTGTVKAGKLMIRIESTGDVDFFDWICHNFEHKNGDIEFTQSEGGGTMKTLSFKQARLVGYEEDFVSFSPRSMTTTLFLVARALSIGTATHESDWAVKEDY